MHIYLLVRDDSYFRQAIILVLNFLEVYVWHILNGQRCPREFQK